MCSHEHLRSCLFCCSYLSVWRRSEKTAWRSDLSKSRLSRDSQQQQDKHITSLMSHIFSWKQYDQAQLNQKHLLCTLSMKYLCVCFGESSDVYMFLTLVYDLLEGLSLNSISLLQLLYDMSFPQALDSASRHRLHTHTQSLQLTLNQRHRSFIFISSESVS